MFRLKARFALAAISATFGLCASAAANSAVSAWVSAAGQDVSGCGTEASPCRTFQYAHDNALGAGGGDILVKDAGNYGPLTIRKTLSVINDGSGTAGTGAQAEGTAITVLTSGNVLLKGLTIDGVGGAWYGIYAVRAANLTIVNCTVQNFGMAGIQIAPAVGNMNFSIQGSLIQNDYRGVYVDGSQVGSIYLARGAVSNSRILGNGWSGIETLTTTGPLAGPIQLEVADTLVSFNGFGISVGGIANTIVALRHSIIARNSTYGFQIVSPAVLQTYGDNVISGNGGNIGTLTPVSTN
jgi:hypothetical protein